MIWVKTAPTAHDGRALPQFDAWCERFDVPIASEPQWQNFYGTDHGGKKVKPLEHAAAVLNLFSLVNGHDVVVASGAPVVKALLGLDLEYVHGIPHRTTIAGREITVFPLLSMGTFFHKGSLGIWANDLKALGGFLRGDLGCWAPDPRPVSSKWLLGRLGPFGRPPCRVAVDTEGWPDRPWGLQFSFDGKTAWVIRADQKTESLQWFRHWVQDKRVVMHNGIHDIAVLRAMGIDLKSWDDTQLMAFHYINVTGDGTLDGHYQNLGRLGYRHAGMLLGELSDLPGVDLEAKVIPYNDEVLNYAGQDAIATWRLAEFYDNWFINNEQTRKVYTIDQGQAPLIRSMMDHGLPFDYDDTADYFLDATEKEAVSSERLMEMAAKRGLHEFNPRSPVQVEELITKKYGLRIRKRTKSGKASTNEKALAIHKDHPFVSALQEHRELTKLIGTYLTPLMRELA